MTATDTLCETGERYERLYWALRAQKALSASQTTDISGSRDPGIPASALTATYPPTNKWGRTRYIWTPSTLRGERYMAAWERAALERQRAEAPGVTADDVKRAKAAYADAKRAMKAAKSQLRLAL